MINVLPGILILPLYPALLYWLVRLERMAIAMMVSPWSIPITYRLRFCYHETKLKYLVYLVDTISEITYC